MVLSVGRNSVRDHQVMLHGCYINDHQVVLHGCYINDHQVVLRGCYINDQQAAQQSHKAVHWYVLQVLTRWRIGAAVM